MRAGVNAEVENKPESSINHHESKSMNRTSKERVWMIIVPNVEI